jgi:hypothetical protein
MSTIRMLLLKCKCTVTISWKIAHQRNKIMNLDFRFISNCKWGFTQWQCHHDNTTHKCTSHIHNTHITYTQIHISNKITPKNKQNKEKQISSQSYTKSERHITANEYRIEKGDGIKLSLLQALEAYRVVRLRDLHIVYIIDLYLAVRLLADRVLRPRIILRNIFWYSFMLESDQTSGSWCGWKDQVPHGEPNPLPSGLSLSASIIYTKITINKQQ